MPLTRRSALGLLAAAPALHRRAAAQIAGVELEPGKFQGSRESLQSYEIPEWFRDAKFGIWAHWGPQSAPEYGDWYARRMYEEGSRIYKYHVQRYGHPSKFGFKDVIPTWKGEKFDAGHLLGLYKKAGARYFMSMGVHHDNFDLWNSQHTRWNALNMGPKKDIVGLFRQAAQRHGLRFGVSEHLWISYKWFATSHGSDKTGPYAGVSYDGVDPRYADLYHTLPPDLPAKMTWNADRIPDSWKQHWLLRIKDLVDQYEPDLLYTDGALPFEEYGLSLVAHHYNRSAGRHGGRTQAVYTSKRREDCETGTCVLDLERGIVDKIWPNPWQTDTCIGDWHYNKEVKYKSPKTVIDMLVDIVSRNGNLMLNFPLPSSGELDPEERKILAAITDWMAVNSGAIHDTRPWKIYGDGPGTAAAARDTRFNERNRQALTAEDVRFTAKGSDLYAFVMGWPANEALIRPLALNGAQGAGRIRRVELLGHKGPVRWTQDETGLKVAMPPEKPCEHAIALKIEGA